jgi:hypothetical protein
VDDDSELQRRFGIEPRMYTTAEVAEILRTTSEALRQQRKRRLGPGPWIRPGREALLHGDDLRRYLEQLYYAVQP